MNSTLNKVEFISFLLFLERYSNYLILLFMKKLIVFDADGVLTDGGSS